MTHIEVYATLLAVTKSVLVQTTIDEATSAKLDKLAKAAARTRSDYIRRLIHAHVKSVTPTLVRKAFG